MKPPNDGAYMPPRSARAAMSDSSACTAEVFGFRRTVTFEHRRYWLLDREEAQRKVDQHLQFLNLGFKRLDSTTLIVAHKR